MAGAAGLALEPDQYTYPLDGVDQWAALTAPGAPPARGPGAGVVHEIGGDNNIHQEAYLEGQYKIIRFHPTIYGAGKYLCTDTECPIGWTPLPGHGGSIQPPAAENNTNGSAALVTGGTWLFDVFADPLEHHDLSAAMPEVVTRLTAALEHLKDRGVVQKLCNVDPQSNPQKYFGGVWTPWRGSRAPGCQAASSGDDDGPCSSPHPGPRPSPSGPDIGVLDGLEEGDAGAACHAKGWCSGAHYGGPPRPVSVLLDGTAAANGTASIPRPVAGDHGFELSLGATCCAAIKTGVHRLEAKCQGSTGGWYQLEHSPLCFRDGSKVPCA